MTEAEGGGERHRGWTSGQVGPRQSKRNAPAQQDAIETEMKRKEQKHLSDMQELKNCVELLPADSQIQDLLNVDIEIPLKSLWGELRYTCNPRRERMDGQISEVKENRLKFIYGEEQVDFPEIWYKTSFAGILYQPDFIHWEQIKNQNIFRYMKDQLELIIFDGERV